MASYPAPSESFIGIIYNPLFFNNIDLTGYVTYAYIQANFLSRVGVATSIASLTTFTGAVTILGLLTLSGGISISGGLTVDTLQVNLTSLFIGQSTFSMPIISSGASITANTILASSIVNNSITQNQIAPPYTLLNSGSSQTILGDKILNGTNSTNDMILNIFSAVTLYTGTIGFIPACTVSYLNPVPRNLDSMMYVGQSIGSGPNQPYGFCICDYNTLSTGFRMSGNGSPGNCNIVMNSTTEIVKLLTLNGGLSVNTGNIDVPGNVIAGAIFCDIFNNYNQITGTDITLNPNNFVQCVVNAGSNSVLPTTSISYGGLKIGWNCSNLIGETDFINMANYTNSGGFNFYTMNATTTPSLIGSLSNSALTINGTLINNKISNSSSTLPYTLLSGSVAIPGGTSSSAGLQIGWNNSSGNGETDFTNLAQGGGGGFQFGIISNTISYRALCTMNPYANQGFWLFSNCGRLRIDDRNGGAFWWGQSQEGSQMLCSVNGISTSYTVDCGNASGVGSTCLTVNTTAVTIVPPLNTSSTITSTGIISAPSFTATNPAGTSNFWGLQTGNANISGSLSTANITAQGLTTFNFNHPTTSLGNNISTNTTQYATVGYVNSISGPSLLALNNIWTGTNAFTQRYISVGNATAPVTIGNGNGNISNVNIGDPLSLGTVSASGSNICISSPLSNSMYVATGGNNICVGSSSGTLLSTGTGNVILGNGCAQTVTTGTNNIVIGNSAWSTGGNFSNCIVIGGSGLGPPNANNQVFLGATTQTLWIQASTTTVQGAILQVNQQIKRLHVSYTLGALTVISNPLPYMILFTPAAGMSFTFPVPSATNSGQTFILRKQAAGAGSVTFSCTGNPAVWVPLDSGTANTSLTITTVWQFTIYSTGSLYLTIA